MKAGRFTTIAILIIASVFTSCSKDSSVTTDSLGQQARTGTTATASNKVTYISEWESGYSWTTSDSAGYAIYRYDKSIPQMSSDVISSGAVLIFVNNYLDDNGVRVTKPQKFPFAVIPDFGRPAYNSYWYYMLSEGNASVKFRSNKFQYSNGPVPLPDGSVQFRYFVLSSSDLSGVGQNQSSIQRLTYEEVANLFGAGL